jgi:hypothetical protein
MRKKGVLFAIVCVAAVLVIGASTIGVLAASGNFRNVGAGNQPAGGLALGRLGVALAPGNGNVTINLDKVEKHGTRWLFHFTVQNNTSAPTAVLGSGQMDQFVLDGMAPPRTPVSQETIELSAPDQTYGPSHPMLARSVGASQHTQGWLEANLAGFPYQPYEVDYRFGTVQTTACSNPQDKSSCHPATLFRVVAWEIS